MAFHRKTVETMKASGWLPGCLQRNRSGKMEPLIRSPGNKFYPAPGLFIGLACPVNVMASDFVVLQVGIGSFILAGLIALLGFKAAASRAGDSVMLYLFLVLLLVFIGVNMVMEEADHMGDYDFWGMLAVISIPGFLAFVVPLVVFYSSRKEAEEKP